MTILIHILKSPLTRRISLAVLVMVLEHVDERRTRK
jgi:hypothetical protein